jgi:hypothetical protein
MQTRSQTSKVVVNMGATPTAPQTTRARQYIPHIIDFARAVVVSAGAAIGMVIALFAVLFIYVEWHKYMKQSNMLPFDTKYNGWYNVFYHHQDEFVANPKHVYDFIDFARSMHVENETVNDLYYRCVQTEEALPFTYMLYNGRYVKHGAMPTYHDLTHCCPKYTTDELIAIAIGFPMDHVVADCMRDGNMGVHHCHREIMKSIREKCAWYDTFIKLSKCGLAFNISQCGAESAFSIISA